MRTRSLAACSARKKNESGPLASEQAKWLIFLFSGLLLAFSGCTFSNRVDNRNFAVDAYSPTPKEIQLAQQRAQHYGPSLFCVGSSKLGHVWEIQIELTGAMVGSGSEVDEIFESAGHSFR